MVHFVVQDIQIDLLDHVFDPNQQKIFFAHFERRYDIVDVICLRHHQVIIVVRIVLNGIYGNH